MSLRLRLFVSLVAAMLVLFALAWWGMRWLTDQVAAEVGQVAVAVGRQVVEVIEQPHDESSVAELVIERTVTDQDREVITRQHRVDGQVVSVSVFVDGEQIDDFDFAASDQHAWVSNLDTLHFTLDDDNRALLLGDHLQRINIPRDGVQTVLQRYSRQMWLLLGLLLVVGLLAAAWAANRLSKPLLQLKLAARQVGAGQWGHQVNEHGAPEVVATIRDFNRMSSQLEKLSEDAERLRARKHLHELGEVARGLAHSLRNPLNVIGLTIDRLAANDDKPESKAELASAARLQIQRIDRSLRSFLVLAGTAADHTDVDLRSVVSDIFLEVSQGDTCATMQLTAGESVYVRGVEAELRAAIQAVVVNAVEADPSGQVEVTVCADAGQATVVVLDRGPGFPEAIKGRLFEPHRTTKAHGSGMGLFITQRIVCHRYNGDIQISDRAGGGSKVSMSFQAREQEPS